MRKNTFQALYAVLMGLFIYSCSGLTLPEKIGIKGTVDLPIKVGAANLNKVIKEQLENAFPSDANGSDQVIEVHNVNYRGQDVQTFFLYLPFEMTEDLNPNSFLKKIDEQINTDFKGDSKEIPLNLVPGIPVTDIPLPGMGLDSDDSLSFVDIAQYVKTISFDQCHEDDMLAGIGFNFVFEEEVPDGLEMTIECGALHFSSVPVRLKQGDNIFGNKEDFSLDLEDYKYAGTKLTFTTKLRLLSDDNTGYWNPDPIRYPPGTPINITGKMHFFREWTEVQIDLTTAINTFAKITEDTGKFPKEAFDLSRLGTYFDGGFEFSDDLKVKIYMECSDNGLIKNLGANLVFRAKYTNGPDDDNNKLYDDGLFVSQPINIDGCYNKDDAYIYSYLPQGDASEHGAKGIDEKIVKGIFQTMPGDLYFLFNIEVEDKEDDGVTPKLLTIKREDVKNADNPSIIKTTMMILLPMSLTAEGKDDETRSAIILPDMFGEDDDLFGRDEAKKLFPKGEISHIKMTIDFVNPIFTDGHLFINKDEETGKDLLFPHTDGIKLNGSRTVVNFTKDQFDIIDAQRIIPKIRIEIEKDGTINIPKEMAIMNIKIDVKGIINVGEH